MFRLRWPDGTQDRCYSPSTVVRQFLAPAASYPLCEFVARARDAMEAASERVRAVHGVRCSRAAATLGEIEARAAKFGHGEVVVVGFEPEPPQ